MSQDTIKMMDFQPVTPQFDLLFVYNINLFHYLSHNKVTYKSIHSLFQNHCLLKCHSNSEKVTMVHNLCALIVLHSPCESLQGLLKYLQSMISYHSICGNIKNGNPQNKYPAKVKCVRESQLTHGGLTKFHLLGFWEKRLSEVVCDCYPLHSDTGLPWCLPASKL